MKQVERKELVKSIEEYLNSSLERPLLLWCHDKSDLYAVKQTMGRMEGYYITEGSYGYYSSQNFLNEDYVAPEEKAYLDIDEKTLFSLHYWHINALETEQIQSLIKKMKERKRPVVLVVDDYPMQENLSLDFTDFVEWEFVFKREVVSDDNQVTAIWWYTANGGIEAHCGIINLLGEDDEITEYTQPLLDIIHNNESYGHREIQKIVSIEMRSRTHYFFYLRDRRGNQDLAAFKPDLVQSCLHPAPVFNGDGKKVAHIKLM